MKKALQGIGMGGVLRKGRLGRLFGLLASVGIFVSGELLPQHSAAQDAKVTAGASPELIASTSVNYTHVFALSPNGRLFAVAEGNAVDLWDVEKVRRIRNFTGLKSSVSAVSFSEDGKSIAAAAGGAREAEIYLWDVETGRLSSSFRTSAPDHFSMASYVTVKTLAFLSDSHELLLGGSFDTRWVGRSREIEIIRIINLSTGAIVRSIKYDGSPFVESIVVSPTRPIAVVGSNDGAVRIFNIREGHEIRSLRSKLPGTVSSVALSPNGQFIASAMNDFNRNRSTIEIWEVESGRLIRSLGEQAGVISAAWAPNGQFLAVRGSKSLQIWNFEKGTLERELAVGWGSPVVRYQNDGLSLFTSAPSTFARIEVSSLRPVAYYGTATANHLVLGTTTASQYVLIESTVKPCAIYAINTLTAAIEKRLQLGDSLEGRCPMVVSSSDGKKFAGIVWPDTDSTLGAKQRLWYLDQSTGANARFLASDLSKTDSFVSMSADGKAVAVKNDNAILVVDAISGAVVRTFEAPKRYPGTVALSPDGKRLVSSDSIGVYPQGGSLYVWDVATGNASAVIRKSQISDEQMPNGKLLFAPDGNFFLGAETSRAHYSVDYWSSNGPRLVKRLVLPDNVTTMWSLAFHPDGDKALVGSWDGRVRLWDLRDGTLIRTFAGHSTEVGQLMFAADAQRIVSSGSDGIKVWNATNGDLLASIYMTGDGEWLEVTPEGFFDASARGTEMLSVVRGLDIYSIDQFFDALHRPDLVREKLAGDLQGKVREAAAKLDLGKVIASGRPPRVAISSPQAATDTNNERVSVEVAVADQGGGIGKIEWRVNGTTFGVDEAPSAQPQAGRAIVLSKELTLEPGSNVIEIVAYNSQGLITSDAARIEVTLHSDVPKKPSLYVLAIGVNDYWDSRLHLAFAASDARAIGDAMLKGGEGLYERTEVTSLIDDKVTSAQIDETFAELGKKVRPRDVFVLFMAGHGKTVDGRFYFIPQDFRYAGEESITRSGIGQDRLQQWLGRIPARKSLLLFDACESGTLTEDQTVRRGMEEMTAIDRLTRAMGRSILTATTDDKPAMEGIAGHGVFTYALLRGLSEAQQDTEGLVDVMEWASYVDRRVPEISYKEFNVRQVPQTKIVGSNFSISNRVTMSSVEPGAGSLASIPKTSTHVVIEPVAVRQAATETARAISTLVPGTQVRLVETTEGWALIARDGNSLGFVETKALARIQ